MWTQFKFNSTSFINYTNAIITIGTRQPMSFVFFYRSIGHFATNICAIVGGVFTVAGIIDTVLYHSIYTFGNKIVLGKAG